MSRVTRDTVSVQDSPGLDLLTVSPRQVVLKTYDNAAVNARAEEKLEKNTFYKVTIFQYRCLTLA